MVRQNGLEFQYLPDDAWQKLQQPQMKSGEIPHNHAFLFLPMVP
jgi:hypothetical protein